MTEVKETKLTIDVAGIPTELLETRIQTLGKKIDEMKAEARFLRRELDRRHPSPGTPEFAQMQLDRANAKSQADAKAATEALQATEPGAAVAPGAIMEGKAEKA